MLIIGFDSYQHTLPSGIFRVATQLLVFKYLNKWLINTWTRL